MHVSRAKLFGTGTALAMIGSGLLGPFILAAEAADEGDIKILDSAASAERGAIKAYSDAAATGLLSPPTLAVAKGFMQDHMAHRDALDGAIRAAGMTPSGTVMAVTYPPLKSESDILAFAETLERGAATAYLTSIPNLKDKALAKVAGSILGVETTHVAILVYTLTKTTEPYKDFIS
jgi:rubrerythrin